MNRTLSSLLLAKPLLRFSRCTRSVLKSAASQVKFFWKQADGIRFYLIIGGLLVLAGLLLGSAQLAIPANNQPVTPLVLPAPVQISPAEANKPTTIIGKPVSLELPRLKIKLQVVDGYYDYRDRSWTLSNDKAHYATITPPVNTVAGSTLIYGHNRKKVFTDLPNVQAGDVAIVTTDNDRRFVYVFKNVSVVSPDDVAIFQYAGPPILTLQTCTGIWYQNRSMYQFTLKEVV